jgi:hypothetical protein
LWIEVATGLHFDARGDVNVLEVEEWNARRTRLNELGGPPTE